MQTAQILNKILADAKAHQSQHGPALAVFDLDSTLYDLRPRTLGILQEFSKVKPEHKQLVQVELRRSDFGLKEPLGRLGIETTSQLFREVHQFWHSRFFSDEFLHLDRPMEGAVEFVSLLAQFADIIYVSGRHVNGMKKGTLASMRTHGFPLRDLDSELKLKPSIDLDDAQFKVEALKEQIPKYQKIWLFENEPVNINRLGEAYPKIDMIFLETCHSGLESCNTEVLKIADFRR